MRFRHHLLRERIAVLFGGSAARLAEHLGVHRSTVTRWLDPLSNLFPRNGDTTVALAAALDLDPALLWEADPREVPLLFTRAREAVAARAWDRMLPALSYLEGLIGPVAQWPPGEVAAQYHREWCVAETDHDPNQSAHYYGSWLLEPASASAPQVWRFASLARGAPAPERWETLGVVTRVGSDLTLCGTNGVVQCVASPAGATALAVQAWFGERARTFRIASLHAFTASLVPEPPEGVPMLRFCACGRSCERMGPGGGRCSLAPACSAYRAEPAQA